MDNHGRVRSRWVKSVEMKRKKTEMHYHNDQNASMDLVVRPHALNNPLFPPPFPKTRNPKTRTPPRYTSTSSPPQHKAT